MSYGPLTEELQQFVDYLLLDEAIRLSSGKTSDEPMRGLFISYGRPSSRRRGKAGARRGKACMHGSDISLRRYVAITALRHAHYPLKRACIEVGVRLGRSLDSELAVIKSSYLKFHPPYAEEKVLAVWRGSFLTWREWVRTAPQDAIDFVAKELMPGRGYRRAVEPFLSLAGRIRGSGGAPFPQNGMSGDMTCSVGQP
jgi:hypothetical protein